MSSLKDWYRYVDSKARSRAGVDAPAERERPAAEPGEAEAADAAAQGEPRAAGGEESLDVWGDLFPGSGKPEPKPTTAPLKRPEAASHAPPPDLPFIQAPINNPPAPRFLLPETAAAIPNFDEFVSPFTPEPPVVSSPAVEVAATPTGDAGSAAPLPTAPQAAEHGARLVESPPAKQAVVSTPAPSVEVAPQPAVAARPEIGEREPAIGGAPVGELMASQMAPPPSTDQTPGPPATMAKPDLAPMAGEEGAAPPATAELEEGQLPWRSPFRLPGPGRTVSSGGPSPRPDGPAARLPSEETSRFAGGALEVAAVAEPSLPARPAPGTPEWERERVDRLARTFRDTLRALEQSIEGARTGEPAAEVRRQADGPNGASGLPGTPVYDPTPSAPPSRIIERARLFRADMPSLLELERERVEPRPFQEPAPAAPVEAPVPTALIPEPTAAAPVLLEEVEELLPEVETRVAVDVPEALAAMPAVVAPATDAIPTVRAPAELTADAPEAMTLPTEASSESAAAPAVAAPRLPLAVEIGGRGERAPEPIGGTREATATGGDALRPALPAAGSPDVLRNIQEAALIRQRLPQHMEMLLRIPTNEVAQNSYKSVFREGREELIGRLLDPQLTLEEAARILGVCPTTVRRYTNRGMLHCHRTPGNQRRFRMSDVLKFLEQFGDRIDRAAEAGQYEEAA